MKKQIKQLLIIIASISMLGFITSCGDDTTAAVTPTTSPTGGSNVPLLATYNGTTIDEDGFISVAYGVGGSTEAVTINSGTTEGATFNAASGTAEFTMNVTPANNEFTVNKDTGSISWGNSVRGGTYAISITGTKGAGNSATTVTLNFNVVIVEANAISFTYNGATIGSGETINLDNGSTGETGDMTVAGTTISDASGTLTYSMSVSPSTISFTVDSSTGKVSWNGVPNGDFQVTLTATKGSVSTSTAFNIVVPEPNDLAGITKSSFVLCITSSLTDINCQSLFVGYTVGNTGYTIDDTSVKLSARDTETYNFYYENTKNNFTNKFSFTDNPLDNTSSYADASFDEVRSENNFGGFVFALTEVQDTLGPASSGGDYNALTSFNSLEARHTLIINTPEVIFRNSTSGGVYRFPAANYTSADFRP